MEISKGKKYKTRDGREVRIYATNGGIDYPIHGAVNSQIGVWEIQKWDKNGNYVIKGWAEHELDLIEVEEPKYRWVEQSRITGEMEDVNKTLTHNPPQSDKHPTILSLTQHGNTITIQCPNSDIDAEELSDLIVQLLRGSGYGDVLLETLIETLEGWVEE